MRWTPAIACTLFLILGLLIGWIQFGSRPTKVEAPTHSAPVTQTKQIYVVLPDGKIIKREMVKFHIPNFALCDSIRFWADSSDSLFFANAAFDSAQKQAEWKLAIQRRLSTLESDTLRSTQALKWCEALQKRVDSQRDELTRILKKGVK